MAVPAPGIFEIVDNDEYGRHRDALLWLTAYYEGPLAVATGYVGLDGWRTRQSSLRPWTRWRRPAFLRRWSQSASGMRAWRSRSIRTRTSFPISSARLRI